MYIELTRKKLKQLGKEEGHTLFEQDLIRYALKLHERMALNNAHESELFHKAKTAKTNKKGQFTKAFPHDSFSHLFCFGIPVATIHKSVHEMSNTFYKKHVLTSA